MPSTNYAQNSGNTHPEARYLWGEFEYMEGVEKVRYEFGPDRVWPNGVAPEPPDEIKGRRTNLTVNQMAAAQGVGVEVQATDIVWTLMAGTLGDDTWKPEEADIIISGEVPNEKRWIVKTVRTVVYGSQYVCMCNESPLNRGPSR